MTKRLNGQDIQLTTDFAIIVQNKEQAIEIAKEYSVENGFEKPVCAVNYKGIEIYQVQKVVFAYIPGHERPAILNLYEGLHSLGRSYRHLFLVTTAVSCMCVKEGLTNGLISIEAIYSESCNDKEEFGFFLPEGAEKMYSATAVSQCNQKLPRSPLHVVPKVLLNLNIIVDALIVPPQFPPLVVMAVNVGKIACRYKQTASVRKLLFDNKQDFIRMVVKFASRMASEASSTLPMTPPGTVKKQRLNHLLPSNVDNKLKTLSKEDYARQKHIIEKFERDILVTTLSPDKLPYFARCLGLTDTDYKNIEYEHNCKNPKEQIHCIVKAWFEKEGFAADVVKFGEALQDMNKELYDNFVLYCKESA